MSTNEPAAEPVDETPQILPFDPSDPAFLEDPYPTFSKLLESGPITSTLPGIWIVAGHQQVSAALRDNRFGHGDGALIATQISTDENGNQVRPLIFMDPPDHTRVRSLVTKAFTARNIERLRPRAKRLMAELLDAARADDPDAPVDLTTAVAYPMAATLIRELLGAPAADHERFVGWSIALGRGLDPDMLLTPEEIEQRDTSRQEFEAYFRELADQRRAEPADDLVTELTQAQDEGDKLTEAEQVAICRVMLSAGYVGTSSLIGNGMLALLRNPDQLAWLRANPDRIADAVEELMRYDPPVQLTGTRIALEDAEVGDQPINQGEMIVLLVGAANHDPAVYDEPDRLDLTRSATAHLGFGFGIHFCLGAPLARLVAQVAIGTLVEHRLELAEEHPPHRPNLIIRSLARLPVRIGDRI